MKHLVTQPHAIFSVENSPYPEKVKNKISHEDAIRHLSSLGGGEVHSIFGHYGSPEKSIFVSNPSDEQLHAIRQLAHQTGQESHIESTGQEHSMLYGHGPQAGKVVRGKGTIFHEQKPKDYFSTLGEGVHFTHNFDFDKSEDLEKGARGDWKNEGYKLSHKEEPEIFRGRHTGFVTHHVTAFSPNGEEAGHYQFSQWPAEDEKSALLDVNSANTHPDHQRKGLASAVYSFIENKTGRKIGRQGMQTADAQKLWSQSNRPFGKSDKIPGGLADKKTNKDFPKLKIRQGTKVEMEHTSDPEIAEEIARDHLQEDLNYYSKLKTIEKKPLQKASAKIGYRTDHTKWFPLESHKQAEEDRGNSFPDISNYLNHEAIWVTHHPRHAKKYGTDIRSVDLTGATKFHSDGDDGYLYVRPVKKSEPLMKPYSSEAQRRWAHTPAGTKALGGKEAVREWDKESKGKDLPEKVNKSNYGPKKLGLYSQADNARRKMSRTGEEIQVGPNSAARFAGPTRNKQAEMQARIDREKSRRNPVKVYSPEERKELASKRGLMAASEMRKNFKTPKFKRGDIVHLSHGIIDPATNQYKINTDKRYVVHGTSSRGEPAHWVVPEGEKDSRKGFYHRMDRMHPVDNSMEKMSRPRITFPNFPELTNRPDQNVRPLETERQKTLFGRQVANADLKDRKVERPVRMSGSRKPITSKPELLDAYGKRVAGKFGRTVLGTSHNTPQGPKSAALAGKLRSKFEEGDDTDKARLDAHKAKVLEARSKYEADIKAWKEKADTLPSGSNAYWEHVANRPKYKAPRRPAKTLKETKDLSPEKMALRGKTVDSTIEHEGFHDLMAHVENKYGPVASSTLVRDLISQHNPETIQAVKDFVLDTMNYKERDPRFNEELITHSRDILVNPTKRERFKTYLQNKLGAGKDSIISNHIKNLKQGHQKAYERAKQIKLADIRPDLAPSEPGKLAASEQSRIEQSPSSWKFPQKPPKRKVTQKWVEAEPFPLTETPEAPAPTPAPMGKAKEDKSIPAKMRAEYRKQRSKFSTDPLEAQVTSKPGVSDRGIEARRGDERVKGTLSHGYARTSSPEEHKERAKDYFKEVGERVKNLPKLNLTRSEEMEKGAARRIFGGLNASKLPGRDQVNEWQTSTGVLQDKDSSYDDETHQSARRDIPRMEEGLRLRALNKLSNRTLTRKHPETGKRQFLLFRGVGPNERKAVLDGAFVQHNDHSSWTPHIGTAKGFEKDYQTQDGPAKTIAAWVDEDNIHAAPHMYGNMPGLQMDMDNAGKFFTPDKNFPGKNEYGPEHEIIVAPHTSDRATKGDVKRYQASIDPTRKKIGLSDPQKDLNARINYRGEQQRSGIKSTKQYPLIRETKPIPSAVLEAAGFGMKKPKKMAASEMAKNDAADQETEKINENKKTAEAKKPHKFKPAKFTHPNGHPRCLICGDEERVGGMCEGISNE